jgi:histidinol-phosphate aminotransferase
MPDARDNIRRLTAYTPGEQPSFRETSGAGGHYGGYAGGIIKLNTNENPYPPSPRVLEAIHALTPEALRLYPPADAAEFRQTAAAVHGVQPDQVIATNGGDELLRLLITVFCPPRNLSAASASAAETSGGGIGMTSPSYTLYEVLAAIQDTPVTAVPREPQADGGFALPQDVAERWNAAGCRLAFLVNPHAPTGRLEPLDTLRQLADTYKGVLVIDEAYVDFAPQSALPLVQEGRDNVVLLRSLSKGYSLAGLRFGYGLGAPDLIAALHKARDSYNVDILAQAAATAAVADQDHARSTWEKVIAERTRLTDALRERGYTVPDSQSNFVLAQVPPAAPEAATAPAAVAESIYHYLKQHDLLIRYFRGPDLADRLRLTVGTAAQNDRLLELLDAQS